MKLCPGDLHIDGDSRYEQIATFLNHVLQVKPDTLILSEATDPWAAPWQSIIESKTFRLVQDTIQQLVDRGCHVVIVLGNHDWTKAKDYRQLLPGVEVVHRYEDEHFKYEHGWQCDWTWNIINPFAFWIARHWPALGLRIYNLITKRTPGSHKGNPTSDWNLHVGLIHDRYRQRALKEGKPYIVWHTHCPWAFDGLIADCGDMVDSFSWLEIEGDKVTLRYLERG